MKKKPLVSVLMPYRKKDKLFSLALNSLRNQTYPRLEILTEEDAGHEGITMLLNRLVKRAKGEFLARMDADDMSEPERIEKQVVFLTAHPDVMLVGTWATLIDENGRKIGIQKMPVGLEEIKRVTFYRNPLIHPSWMMRKAWVKKIGGYNPDFRFSQDWELILRRVKTDKIENIPEPLIRLRIHKTSSSFSNNKEQLRCGIRARLGAIWRKDVKFSKILYLIPSLISLAVPTHLKYIYRKGI
ncbi:glycosyltransferase [Candidatus Jorgensenbacteria bacterium]|nr:glycosyltransferase [Candidatus Jorgensenbacteria bacterium]